MPDQTIKLKEQADRNMIEKSFKDAITEVIGTMAGMDVWEAGGLTSRSEMQAKQFLSGVMMITGQKNAMVSITVSRDTAAILVSYMTGVFQSKITQEDLCDGMAELVNMVAGRAKIQLADTEYSFKLTTPFVIIGDSHSIYQKCNVKNVSMKFIVQDMELLVEVFFL